MTVNEDIATCIVYCDSCSNKVLVSRAVENGLVQLRQDGWTALDPDTLEGKCPSCTAALVEEEEQVGPPEYYLAYIDGGRRAVQCCVVAEALGMHQHHYINCAFEYLWRCLHKGQTRSDLKKAAWHIGRALATLDSQEDQS